MDKIINFNKSDILPDKRSVLKNQGIPENVVVSEIIHSLLKQAIDIFLSNVRPVGLISEVTVKEFEKIFYGEGENERDNPLVGIFPKSDNLALFAITMGSEISKMIESLFDKRDFALASMLDSVASLAADKAVKVFEKYFFNLLTERNSANEDFFTLSYSPGYCGWHISGQKKFFQYLKPGRINISLNSGFLMSPLKSVTGVLVAGKKEIHFFENNYPFCENCKTHSCIDRINNIIL